MPRRRRLRVRTILAMIPLLPTAAASAGAQEPSLVSGETIRVEVGSQVAGTLAVPSPLEAVFIMVSENALVASSPFYGRVAVPLASVESIRVQRTRNGSHAFVRGGIIGAAFGVGMWRFLEILCRDACDGGIRSAWFPSTVTGALVGLLVVGQGPGTHWVPAQVPAPQQPRPGGAIFSLPVPWGR